ncbi:MAG TPA: hypothetical protein VGL49_01520 [Acidimicrobiales bacterium]
MSDAPLPDEAPPESPFESLSPAAAVRILRDLARADHHRRGTQYVGPLLGEESAA